MRDIYFRGKAGFYPNNFIYGDLVRNKHGDLFILNIALNTRFIVIKKTVGQFTGANDKHGNMIFEGDIIRDPDGNIGRVEYSLRYLDYRIVYFNMKSGRYYERNYCLRLSDWLYLYPKLDVEIIDNIHDSADYLTKDYNNE